MTDLKLQNVPVNHRQTADSDDSRTVTITPRIDILENDNEIMVYLDMPGVKPEDVDVRFEDGELTVNGRRSTNHANKARISWESNLVGYNRSFRVTERIASDKITASINNGVLALQLPKVETVKPRRIAVQG